MIKRILCVILATLFLFFSFVQNIAADGSDLQPEFDNIVPEEGEPEFGDTRVVIPPMIFPPDNILYPSDYLTMDVSWNLRYRNSRGNLYTPTYLDFTTQDDVDLTGYAHSLNFDTWYKTNLYYGEFIEFTGYILDDSESGGVMFSPAGNDFTLYLEGMMSNMQVNYAEYDIPWTTLRPDVHNGTTFYVYLYDKLGNEILLDSENILLKQGASVNTWDMEIRVRGIDFDIYRMTLYWSYLPTEFWPGLENYIGNASYTYTHWFGFSSVSGKINYKDDSPDTGIFYWLAKLFDTILYLPATIIELLMDALSSLFVPSEEFLVSFKDKFDVLFANRFGAVYQSATLVEDLYGGITDSDAQDTIHMPAATLEFDDTEFTFGGYDVRIVPEGFEFLAEICKKAISIVCTIWFANGLKKRYEEIIDK